MGRVDIGHPDGRDGGTWGGACQPLRRHAGGEAGAQGEWIARATGVVFILAGVWVVAAEIAHGPAAHGWRSAFRVFGQEKIGAAADAWSATGTSMVSFRTRQSPPWVRRCWLRLYTGPQPRPLLR
jgi:hypothetical protein